MIRVTHHIDDLADDLRAITIRAPKDMSGVVRSNVKYGRELAQTIARAKSGPHGKAYHKRITSEMTDPLQGEYGPSGRPKTEFVGAGFRSGTNTDLPTSADAVGPKFADDVRRLPDKWFWPNS